MDPAAVPASTELTTVLGAAPRFVPVIHPTSYIAPGAFVIGDVTLGAESSVWYNCVLRGDSSSIVLGEQSNLQDLTVVHVDEGIPCRIGSRVGVGHRAILHGCVVEDESLIGMGAILLNNAVVGTGSLVAAGAVVKEGAIIPPRSLVAGVPARVVRTVDDGLAERIRQTWEHYVVAASRHRKGEFEIVKGGA